LALCTPGSVCAIATDVRNITTIKKPDDTVNAFITNASLEQVFYWLAWVFDYAVVKKRPWIAIPGGSKSKQ
jgi:hypothetical protein